MLQAEAGFVFIGFILYFSGVQGRVNRICALNGSSVDLLCSAGRPTSSMKWYTVDKDGSTTVQSELSADGNHVTYNMSEETNFTLTIKDVSESDAKLYCCGETNQSETCRSNRTELSVTDLQVKVIPSTEGQTVTLMCSTSCPLTENPAAYIWYKNREFLYQDWSPWYQQLVSSDQAVTYSCAIKGYEDLRAPEVSVDSVTPACFNVTFAKGRMCSYKQRSEDEPCSITHPTEIYVHRTPAAEGHMRLTCNTSCPLTDIVWYENGYLKNHNARKPLVFPITTYENFSCAVKGLKELHSASVCVEGKNCWSVNYVSRRICALQGSSVNISSEYSHPDHQKPSSKLWYKIRSGNKDAERLSDNRGHVKFHDIGKNHHILSISNLRKRDSAEYIFRLLRGEEGWKQPDLPGVTLVVTDLKVKFMPSAEVTEGQRVTLICSTSCPLTDNTTYMWYLNSRPLNLPEIQDKHLLLDPVSSKHAGNYSCAIETPQQISSREKTLTVQRETGKWTTAAAIGVCVALLILITFALFWWIRRKRTSRQSSRTETSDNLEQLGSCPVYDEISAPPKEQDDIYYSKVHFPQTNTTDPLYSTVSPDQLKEQEHVPYAVVSLRAKMAPE